MPALSSAADRPFDIDSFVTAGATWEAVTVPDWVRKATVQNPAVADGGGGGSAFVSKDATAAAARNAVTDNEVVIVVGGSATLHFSPKRSTEANTFLVCTPGGAEKLNVILEG